MGGFDGGVHGEQIRLSRDVVDYRYHLEHVIDAVGYLLDDGIGSDNPFAAVLRYLHEAACCGAFLRRYLGHAVYRGRHLFYGRGGLRNGAALAVDLLRQAADVGQYLRNRSRGAGNLVVEAGNLALHRQGTLVDSARRSQGLAHIVRQGFTDLVAGRDQALHAAQDSLQIGEEVGVDVVREPVELEHVGSQVDLLRQIAV